MKDYTVQFQICCIALLLVSVRCHLYFPPDPPGAGFPFAQPGFDFGFRGSRPTQQDQPVVFNTVPHYQQLPIFPLRPVQQFPPIQVYRIPDHTVLVPLKTFNGFPSLIERLVQRIQTYYSVYNPVESLTRPPPDDPPTTNKAGSKGPVQSVQVMTSNSSQEESTVVGDVTVTTSKTSIKNKVPTLTIYEISPSESTTIPTTTTSLDDEDTTIPPDIETTEEPNFISPENASVAAKASSGFRYENFPLEHFFYKPPSKRPN